MSRDNDRTQPNEKNTHNPTVAGNGRLLPRSSADKRIQGPRRNGTRELRKHSVGPVAVI